MDLLLPPRRMPPPLLPPDDEMEFLEERYMTDEDVLHLLERREWSAEVAAADLYTGGRRGGRCQAWEQRLALFNGSEACLEECQLRRSSASV